MSTIKNVFILVTILILWEFDSVSSLKCFKCSGPLNQNTACGHLNGLPPTECDSASQVCGLYVVENPGTEILHRNCYPRTWCEDVKSQIASPAYLKQCELCETDGCNSADVVTVSIFSLVAVVLFHFLLC